MRYIAALDYQHLDNGVFLTSLAKSIAQQKQTRPIVVHGDSDYTERVIQTGVMREDARVRSIKDLNHRLVALFADQGVSVIGLNGYQRKFITKDTDKLTLDASFFDGLPHAPLLLISTLVWDENADKPTPVGLAKMTSFLQGQLQTEGVFAFSAADKDEIFVSKKTRIMTWKDLPHRFTDEYLPQEFHQFNKPLRLTTARDFHKPFQPDKSIIIR